MDEKRSLPTALKVVAVLFIIGGVLAVIDVLVSLTVSRLSFNFGVLGLFIGPGLLALRRGWRTCALVFTWIGLLVMPLYVLLLLGHNGPVDFVLFGQKLGYVSKELAFLTAGVLFLVDVWQYRVLTRPDVRALFGLGAG